ncbi:MAG: hypothetical protein ABWY05_03525 [Noviherbaspirillum sp.]
MDNFVHKCAQSCEAGIKRFVNPVDSHRVFIKKSLKINGLIIFPKIIDRQSQNLQPVIDGHNFVHKSKIEGAAEAFNNHAWRQHFTAGRRLRAARG